MRIIGRQPRRTKGAEAASGVWSICELMGVSFSETVQFVAAMGLAHIARPRGGQDREQGRGHSHYADTDSIEDRPMSVMPQFKL